VLNPAAWANPANGVFGTAALYNDFRAERRPQENLSLARNFRIKERMNMQIRAEFTNVFNRTSLGNPITTNPGSAPAKNAQGQYVSGFGIINLVSVAGSVPSTPSNGAPGQLGIIPRQGTLIARFTF
jgi:hypothetical protein